MASDRSFLSELLNMSSKCVHCGAPLTEGAEYCSYCGSPVSADASPYSKEGEFFTSRPASSVPSTADPFSNTAGRSGQMFDSGSDSEASLVLKIIAFLFPFIGLIIYLIRRRNSPAVAKSLLPWVIAGIVKNAVVSSIDRSYASLSTAGQIGRMIGFIS